MKPSEPVESAAPRPTHAAASAWSPLQNTLFRSLWIATIVSNIGTWMQDVGAGWLMTSLSSSPSMVALVEAADSFPVMLLALPAGALADILDRRRLLIGVQVYLLIVASALGILTWLDMITAWSLIGFTFALGVGAALVMPAWAAIVPELVPIAEMPSAIALNSIAINVSRAIGPAIAGVLVAAVGAWLVFILNAVSYVGILAVLLRWRREHHKSTLPAERFVECDSRRHALRHAHASAAERAHSRHRLLRVRERDLVVVSAHRAAGARPRPRNLRPAPDMHRRRRGCGCAAAAALAREALPGRPRCRCERALRARRPGACALQNVGLLAVAMLATGVAWISILSALQVSAQLTLPAWVRARGLAAFVVVFMGGMALGSLLWGQVATRIGIPDTLTAAALGMVVAIALTWGQARQARGARLHAVDGMGGARDCRDPRARQRARDGDHRIPGQATKRAEFVAAMQAVREMRRRNGAYYWELFHDSADPVRFVECFMDESWVEHLRQHERVSVADREIQRNAKQYLVEGATTTSQHWLADREP